tara:strand:+ start:155 stop:685 length:531 start_codon:yes stop_codon:yes gene_type:complete
MTDRLSRAQQVIDDGLEHLKTKYSMTELQNLFCTIVNTPQAPKFSDKTAAAKRVIKMAQEVVLNEGDDYIPEIDEVDYGTAEQPKVVKTKGRPKTKPREYIFSHRDDSLLPKQASDIVKHIELDVWIDETLLMTKVNELAESGKLKTKQKPWRIFQYYRAKMINQGIVKMRNVADA